MSSSVTEVTDWPGQDQLEHHPCSKVSGPSRLGWAGLAGGFLPRVRALAFCIVLAWVQQCGFLRLLLLHRPWPFLGSSHCVWLSVQEGERRRCSRQERAVLRPSCFIPRAKGRRCYQGTLPSSQTM